METERMIDIMCEMSGVDRDVLFNTRKGMIPTYRAMIYLELRKAGVGTCQIGRIFGKNHATVIVACDTLRDIMCVEKKTAEFYSRFKERVNG